MGFVFFFYLKTSCIASHLLYNNVSCILRCVFTLLHPCVLVGFDWHEPMMFLLLHLTCSCIFMHTYFTFSIFIYIELFWDFSENFSRHGVHSDAKSSCRTSSTLTYPLSFTVGVRSHFVTSRSLVPPWSYRSFTPICTESILQYLISSLAFEVHAL